MTKKRAVQALPHSRAPHERNASPKAVIACSASSRSYCRLTAVVAGRRRREPLLIALVEARQVALDDVAGHGRARPAHAGCRRARAPPRPTFRESPRKPSSAWPIPAANAWCCCSGARRPRACASRERARRDARRRRGIGDVTLQPLVVAAQRESTGQSRREEPAPRFQKVPLRNNWRSVGTNAEGRDANEANVLPGRLQPDAAAPRRERDRRLRRRPSPLR